jgi:hypothetical protein
MRKDNGESKNNPAGETDSPAFQRLIDRLMTAIRTYEQQTQPAGCSDKRANIPDND